MLCVIAGSAAELLRIDELLRQMGIRHTRLEAPSTKDAERVEHLFEQVQRDVEDVFEQARRDVDDVFERHGDL